jgi:Fe-S-cluster containining protein
MTLTEEDERRISALGYKDYYKMHKGFIQLRNIDGRCFFLREGHCKIHKDKPIGCKLYPLVLDIDEWEVVLHDFCPNTDHFHFDEKDVKMLKETIKTEEEERRKRLSPARKKRYV